MGSRRHPRGVAVDLLALETHPRNESGADGRWRRRPGRSAVRFAAGASRNGQLARAEPRRLHRLCRHRPVPVRYPPGARSPWPRAILPVLREGGVGRGIDRRARRRGEYAVVAAHRRHRRDRAADRVAELHRGRHPPRRRADIRSAVGHFSFGFAAARRRRHRAGRSRGGRRVLPAADGESEAQ